MSAANLSTFIRTNSERILSEWEKFAQAIPAGVGLDLTALRDHATGMLGAIADYLDSKKTAAQLAELAKGLAPGAEETEAQLHGSDRMRCGFSISESVSEFRALRATVLRLWTSSTDLEISADDLTRFNEAIDLALAESVQRYSADKERNSRLFDKLLSTSPDLNYIFDAQGRLIYANEAMTHLLAKPLQEVIGRHLSDLDATLASRLDKSLREVIATNQACRAEVSNLSAAGDEVTYEFLLAPITDDHGQVEAVTGTARDVTRRKESEEQSRRSANYDALTDLPNRTLFFERLDWEVKGAERTHLSLALLFIDIDYFKEVNDRLGHDIGDQVLQLAARRISDCVRGSDTVARMGGDEFTVIITAIKNAHSIEKLAQKIIATLATPFVVENHEISLSGSIGITLFPQDAETPGDLVRNADYAMYEAKRSGRNRFTFFTTDMQSTVSARKRMISALREALPQHQLTVYYQPIVELSSRKLLKAEALLRWNHPETGLMLPGEFLGIAEEAGLISRIDRWVTDEAAKQAREWGKLTGAPFQISVNRSPQEFTSEDFIYFSGDDVSVNFPESVLASDSPKVRENLNRLQEAGVYLAVDHYGTANSSIVDLKNFHIACLKIDQSFVQGRVPDVDNRVITETIIMMAHKLGIKVAAEGVETVEQENWLKSVDCDYAQGFLFSAAVPAHQFTTLLAAPAAG